MMEIEMARGDILTKSFVIRGPDKQPYTTAFDDIFFTVKKTAEDRDFKFQKRLSTGGIEAVLDDGTLTGTYQFTIMPEDTDDLLYGDYVFDIELLLDGVIKRTFLGRFRMLKEVTHHYNEE